MWYRRIARRNECPMVECPTVECPTVECPTKLMHNYILNVTYSQGRIWGCFERRWNPLGSTGGPDQKKFWIACSSNWMSAPYITLISTTIFLFGFLMHIRICIYKFNILTLGTLLKTLWNSLQGALKYIIWILNLYTFLDMCLHKVYSSML